MGCTGRINMSEVSLAGCVIVYNPDKDVIDNIATYIGSLEKLYVVDNGNGEIIVQQLSSKYSNITVIEHKENMGIAFSLNEVLTECNDKYTHLLTMDQDSRFTEGSIEKYLNEIINFNWSETLGIAPKIIEATMPPRARLM